MQSNFKFAYTLPLPLAKALAKGVAILHIIRIVFQYVVVNYQFAYLVRRAPLLTLLRPKGISFGIPIRFFLNISSSCIFIKF